MLSLQDKGILAEDSDVKHLKKNSLSPGFSSCTNQ